MRVREGVHTPSPQDTHHQLPVELPCLPSGPHYSGLLGKQEKKKLAQVGPQVVASPPGYRLGCMSHRASLDKSKTRHSSHCKGKTVFVSLYRVIKSNKAWDLLLFVRYQLIILL